MEELLIQFAQLAKTLSEAAAVLVVTFGSLEAFVKLVWVGVTRTATPGMRKAIWRRFGSGLRVGPEFGLAADIIGTVVSPTWQDIAQLGAIAVSRTFLNYDPEKDLERAKRTGEEPTPMTRAGERVRPATAS